MPLGGLIPYNGGRRRRIPFSQYMLRRRTNFLQYGAPIRRRYIPPNSRSLLYRRRNLYTPRVLGNPLAITERKYTDLEREGTVIQVVSTNWTNTLQDPSGVLTFVAPPVGTSWQQRIGRKIQLIGLRIKGEVGIEVQNPVPAGGLGSPTVRLIVFQDKQANALIPDPNDVIFSGSAAVGPAIEMFQNGASFGRFKVWKDYRVVLNNPFFGFNGVTYVSNSVVQTFMFDFKFNPPITIHFNGANTGSITDVVDNAFHLMVGSDVGQPLCFIHYKSRGIFYDA